MEICAGGAASDALTGVVRMGAVPPLRVMCVALCLSASANAECGMGRCERRPYGWRDARRTEAIMHRNALSFINFSWMLHRCILIYPKQLWYAKSEPHKLLMIIFIFLR
jgi:hypothetical protein